LVSVFVPLDFGGHSRLADDTVWIPYDDEAFQVYGMPRLVGTVAGMTRRRKWCWSHAVYGFEKSSL
jgi:hypothetical protein